MSLKVKIASIISALVIVVSVAGALIHYSVFSSTFELLEEEEVIEDLDEITRAFDAEIRDLERITRWYVASTTGPPPLHLGGGAEARRRHRSGAGPAALLRRLRFGDAQDRPRPG